jgi:hypothetical protein
MTIGEPAMNAIKQFFLALLEGLQEARAYKAKRLAEKYTNV